MNLVWKILRPVLRHYALRTDDADLMRAQFREFIFLIPLLYLILACNSVAVTVSFSDGNTPILSTFLPAILAVLSTARGIWWFRRRNSDFTDPQIRKHIKNTSILAVLMAVAFVAWGMAIYRYGDAHARAHIAFYLAVTQISCVFCLIPLRSAALSVATVGIAPFSLYLIFADDGRMLVEAIILGLVGIGMVIIVYRQNQTFAQLIHSQRALRIRQFETQKLSDENRHIAFTDPLSALPNRRALVERLEDVFDETRLEPDTLAVIFVDLDNFKDINDDHGHHFGDALITRVGSILEKLRPECAMLARMGGDEFAVLLECPQATEQATALAKRILAAMQLPMHLDGRLFHIGASIGVAGNFKGVASADELMRRADTAMYKVKENGRGGTQLFHPSFDEGRARRQLIERDISGGLKREEFDVVYQPLVDARSGTTVGVEALIRWPRRTAGSLTPDEFIEIAEASGLIQPLGLFVLERACHDLRDHPQLNLSVNVSPAQFRHREFVQEISEVLRKTGFAPERLQLEITERNLIDRPESASRSINALKTLGVSFALDDFGTGFTSIAYLQSYGFSRVKIDRSLVARLGDDANASMLISGMVFMAAGLNMEVTAEGVENPTQAELLSTAGCHILQGYLYGRPAALRDLDAACGAVPQQHWQGRVAAR